MRKQTSLQSPDLHQRHLWSSSRPDVEEPSPRPPQRCGCHCESQSPCYVVRKLIFPGGIHVTRKQGPHNAASSSSELSSELPYASMSIGRTLRGASGACLRSSRKLGGAARGPGRDLAATSRTGPRRPRDRAGPARCGSRPGCSCFRSSFSFSRPRGYGPRPLGGSTHARAGGRGKGAGRARWGGARTHVQGERKKGNRPAPVGGEQARTCRGKGKSNRAAPVGGEQARRGEGNGNYFILRPRTGRAPSSGPAVAGRAIRVRVYAGGQG